MTALSQLAEASYESASFPVSAIDVQGGNDFAEHTAYLRRGADMEPCGQKAYRGSFTIPCINTPRLVAKYGTLYPDLLNQVVSLFESTPLGLLTLPGYNSFEVAVTGWTSKLSPDQQGGTDLEVQFIEHNGTAALLTGPEGTASTPTPSTTLAAATAADSALTAYKPAAFPLLAKTVGDQLAVLESAALGYSAVAQCFRAMLLPIDAYLALPALRAASAHAATLALLALQSSVYDLRSRYAPTMVQARRFTVPETMALWQVARLVYGDASLTTLLRAANAISDPLAVQGGTVLTILPAPITAG